MRFALPLQIRLVKRASSDNCIIQQPGMNGSVRTIQRRPASSTDSLLHACVPESDRPTVILKRGTTQSIAWNRHKKITARSGSNCKRFTNVSDPRGKLHIGLTLSEMPFCWERTRDLNITSFRNATQCRGVDTCRIKGGR